MTDEKDEKVGLIKKETKMDEIKRKLSDHVASYSSNLLLFLFVYFWGWLDFSFLWIVLYLIGHQLNVRRKNKREIERKIAKRIVKEGEEQVLKVCILIMTKARDK